MTNIHNYYITIKEYITNITLTYKYKFITSELRDEYIYLIKNTFKKLNEDDIDILSELIVFLIDVISYKNYFSKEQKYNNYWGENNNRNIKSLITLLLPYINNEKDAYDNIEKLSDIIISNEIHENNYKDLLQIDKKDILKKYFKYSNIALQYLTNTTEQLDFIKRDAIYKILYTHLNTLLQTLEIINGKYYINWINIVPITITQYMDSDIFINTINILNTFTSEDNIKDIINYNKTLIDYNGLWFGDIYNIIYHKFYIEMKRLKWLIFPYKTNNGNFYLINILDNLLNLCDILNNNTTVEHFTIKIKLLLDNFKTLSIIDKDAILYMLIFFTTRTGSKFFIDLDINDVDEKDNEFTNSQINKINSLKDVDIYNYLLDIYNHKDYVESLYLYIYDTVVLFKDCAYGRYLIEYDGLYYFTNTFYYKNTSLNYKNIYNISKSLVHKNLSNWEILNDNYLSLTSEKKILFFKKIYDSDDKNIKYKEWLNIKNNIKLENRFLINTLGYDDQIHDLYMDFKNNYIYLIFENLIYNGLLSKFVVNEKITNEKLILSNRNSLSIYVNDNKSIWGEYYYYVTNTKIKYIKDLKDGNKNKIYSTFFDAVIDNYRWMTFYSMDFICQINFYRHYIFHQIIYVTGATGQGKTTQVPKLIYYSLKMIDYKAKYRLICTAPRIKPLKDNARQVSFELGVPINKENFIESSKYDNYYVQYTYSIALDSHNINNNMHIKFVTDGLLINKISNNISLFDTTEINKNNMREKKFINNVIYDILFIDEVHEHSTNMDLILTLLRQTCYINNKIRLYIVSATMDLDEPIYRRYYNNINDNLLYPLKENIYDPILNRIDILDLRYSDRRFHISPPMKTTQYNIKEEYLNTSLKFLTNKEEFNYGLTSGYNKIMDLCKTTLKGHILLFSIGEKEINTAVKYLNSVTPINVVALPYYTKLNEKYKNIIDKIGYKLSTIKNKKEDIYNEWGGTYIEGKHINNFQFAIIVATNIAEASITIPNLYYVIETGFTKTQMYTDIRSNSSLKITHISEMNRLQRKGRVGRIGPGEIYYMYPKGRKEKEQFIYNITQSLIYKSLYSMVDIDINYNSRNIDEISKYLFITSMSNPNNRESMLCNNSPSSISEKANLLEIYKKNYNKDINVTEYNDTYNKEYYIYCDSNLKTAQTIDSIFDKDGVFYIIHLFENSIIRNILNNIISYDNIRTNIIPITAYYDFLIYSSNLNIIHDNFNIKTLVDFENIKLTKILDLFSKIEKLLTSKIGDKSSDKSSDIKHGKRIFGEQVDYEYCIIIITSFCLDCLEEIYNIIIFLISINYSLNNIVDVSSAIDNREKNIIFDNFKNLYIYLNSDILCINTIINNFKTKFSYLLLYSKIPRDTKEVIQDIVKYTYLIKSWCDENIIDSKVFLEYIYNTISSDITIANIKYTLSDFTKYKKYFVNNINVVFKDKNEKIIYSFLSGFPLHILYNNFIFTHKNIYPYKYISNILTVTNNNIFALYLKINTDDDIKLNIISYVKKEWLNTVINKNIKYLLTDINLYHNQTNILYNNDKKIYDINIANIYHNILIDL